MKTKEKLLKLLLENNDKYISGQEIAEFLGISRNAVWKSVSKLRNDGYEIDAQNNLGYKIIKKSSKLSPEGIKAFFGGDKDKIKIICLDTTDSTNNEAKKLVASGETSDMLITAEEQTKGRGRSGHSFYSPDGTGLYMTLVLHPKLSVDESVFLTTAAAVSVVKAIKEITGRDSSIKWVNDVFMDGKKVCGILTEAVSDFETMTVSAVIVGIGINISTSLFPEDIRKTAGSIGGNACIRNELAAKISENLISLCKKLPDKSYMDDYRKYSFIPGKKITYTKNGCAYSATAEYITNDAYLVVKRDDGTEEILKSGEISVRAL